MRRDLAEFIRSFGLFYLRVQTDGQMFGQESSDPSMVWYDHRDFGSGEQHLQQLSIDQLRKLDAWHVGYLMALGIDEDGERHFTDCKGECKEWGGCKRP